MYVSTHTLTTTDGPVMFLMQQITANAMTAPAVSLLCAAMSSWGSDPCYYVGAISRELEAAFLCDVCVQSPNDIRCSFINVASTQCRCCGSDQAKNASPNLVPDFLAMHGPTTRYPLADQDAIRCMSVQSATLCSNTLLLCSGSLTPTDPVLQQETF